jgi:hypothetical protein
MAIPITMADLSTTAATNSPAGTESPSSGDDFLRSIQAILRTTNAKGADIPSATTTDIGAATGEFVDVTGTTTITGLGTVSSGIVRTVRFTGALTLTHNATSLILPSSANITTANGDVAQFRSLGSGNWKCTNYIRQAGNPLAIADASITPAKLSAGAPSWDTAARTLISGTTPNFTQTRTGSATDEKSWRQSIGATTYTLETLNDAVSVAATAYQCTRSGNSVITHSWFTSGSLRANIDTNGVFAFNSGYGSAVAAYGCRVWISFNGTGTPAIRGSGNVTSITDNAVGDFTINFTTALVDANYAFTFGSQRGAGTTFTTSSVADATAPTTSALRVNVYSQTAGVTASVDSAYNSVAIFR